MNAEMRSHFYGGAQNDVHVTGDIFQLTSAPIRQWFGSLSVN